MKRSIKKKLLVEWIHWMWLLIVKRSICNTEWLWQFVNVNSRSSELSALWLVADRILTGSGIFPIVKSCDMITAAERSPTGVRVWCCVLGGRLHFLMWRWGSVPTVETRNVALLGAKHLRCSCREKNRVEMVRGFTWAAGSLVTAVPWLGRLSHSFIQVRWTRGHVHRKQYNNTWVQLYWVWRENTHLHLLHLRCLLYTTWIDVQIPTPM